MCAAPGGKSVQIADLLMGKKEPPFGKGGGEQSEPEGFNHAIEKIPLLSPLAEGGQEKI